MNAQKIKEHPVVGWLSTNLMAIVIAGLVTAFFIDFQSFKKDVSDTEKIQESYRTQTDARLYILEVINIIQNPNLTQEQKNMLMNLYRRGFNQDTANKTP